MKCRYCGAVNPPISQSISQTGEERCVKCQRRMLPANQPILQSAAVPELRPATPPAPPAAPRVVGGAGAAAAPARALQKPLFAYREAEKVVPIGAVDSRRPVPKPQPQAPVSPRVRATSAISQETFDFAAPPPSRPLTREMERSQRYEVAPLVRRAEAALYDSVLIMALCAAFAASVRTTLGYLPLTPTAFPYWGGAFIILAFIYKLAWCLAERDSMGLIVTGLRLVSFDSHRPSFAQRMLRFFSGWFSLAAGGMGLLWAVADQERLTWHDHISQTFLTADPRQKGQRSATPA